MELFGLTNTPQFNGKKGKVIDFDEEAEGYVIDIEGVGEVVLEEKNIKWVSEPAVDSTHLEGVVERETTDWSKLEFKADEVVRITGRTITEERIKSEKAMFEGSTGSVVDFHKENGCYVVQLHHGSREEIVIRRSHL